MRRLVIPLFVSAFLVAGCASDPFRDSFVADPGAAVGPPAAKDAPVRVRNVPWERVDRARAELNQRIVDSSTPPSEWTAEQKTEARAVLLQGLQYTEDPARFDVLGASNFRTTDPVDTRDRLLRFARHVGATDVAWSSQYLGKADKIVSEPVTNYTTGSVSRRRAGHRNDTYSETSTTYIPIRVEADEWAYYAVFLRLRP